MAEDTQLPPTVSVTIPQQAVAWNIGIEAHYFQPANSDPNMATAVSSGSNGNTVTLSHTDTHTYTVHMKNNWGEDLILPGILRVMAAMYSLYGCAYIATKPILSTVKMAVF